MKVIEYKNSKELGLKIYQESLGFTVLRIACAEPKMVVLVGHNMQ